MAVALAVSLLPAVVAPAAPVRQRAAVGSYADWLRLQLRVPADDAFEAALEEASATRPGSLRTFLQAFIDAYEAHRPQESLAAVFAPDDLSDDALIAYLQSRYQRVAAEAPLPRLTLVPAVAPSGASTDRASGILGTAVRPAARFAGLLAAAAHRPAGPVLSLIRILSSAHPLGP